MYLPDEHHISRVVPYKKQLRDANDNPIGLLPEAFEMREHLGEKNLSVDWLEYHDGTHTQNIHDVARAARKRMGFSKSANSIFGIGKIGILKGICSENGHTKVQVAHNQRKAKDSHSIIIRLPMNEASLMQALADNVFTNIVPNKSIP